MLHHLECCDSSQLSFPLHAKRIQDESNDKSSHSKMKNPLNEHRPASLGFAVLLFVTCCHAISFAASPVTWIWTDDDRRPNQTAFFRKTFEISKQVVTATIRAGADFNDMVVFLNGTRVGEVENYTSPLSVNVTGLLKDGDNLLEITCKTSPGPAACYAKLALAFRDGTGKSIVSNETWRASLDREQGWQDAVSFGPVSTELTDDGQHRVGINSLDDYTQWKQALNTDKSADPSAFLVAPGFQIELLRSAQKDEGSWVSLAVDPKGRLVIAKEDRGLLRMTLAEDGRKITKIETIEDTLQECRGLLFAFDSLYVNANNSKGFYRLRDTNGDDQFDEVKLLYKSSGNVGHGRNDLALGPDERIYLIHGDAVDLPDGFIDRTSPFREHRRGVKTREGHVIRTDKDGKKWELIAAGLRNPYGIDFNQDGEMFTYDADAEFDMGSPWYRPTRVNHLVSGGDFGWRGVTGQWPPYFPNHPDNALPNLDIGKGSPTGVKFGTRSNFPPRYRRALFILDWAYGRIIAVHMIPRGASYLCTAETFLKGRPLNVTDLDFGPDGSMYVVTGGRKTQAGLYRVSYVGPKVKDSRLTAQQRARTKHHVDARSIRRELESFHGRQDRKAINVAWPHINNADPWIRHAARIAIEHQAIEHWKKRALDETRPTAALTACMALARSQAKDATEKIVAKLNATSLGEFSTTQKLTALQTYALCLAESKSIDRALTVQTIKKLDSLYPDRSALVNQQLSRLLVKLSASTVVPKTLRLLASAANQRDQFHHLFALRNVNAGWTMDGRRDYFRALRQTKDYLGGQGMPGFLKKIREEATATLTEKEKIALGSMVRSESQAGEPVTIAPRPLVRKWTLDDLVDSLGKVGGSRNFERGRELFAVASCNRCHRVGVEGTLIGPDLTSASRRFSRRDLLESILSPSKVIPENYRSVRIVTTDGKSYVGRIIPAGDYRSPTLRLATNADAPHEFTEITKSKIEVQQPSPVSWMPEGLLNTLNKDEILDLLAFIEAGGQVSRKGAKAQSN